MKFVWAGDREKRNARLTFSIALKQDCDTLVLYAADYYQVFADGEFLSYGPERTAAGYARRREIGIVGVKTLTVYVGAYNVNNYEFDRQPPFFGAQILKNGVPVYGTTDFSCFEELSRIAETPKFSSQRGFIEAYDFHNTHTCPLQTYFVDAPKLLNGIGDKADYKRSEFDFVGEGVFEGFSKISPISWENNPRFVFDDNRFDYKNDFLNKIGREYTAYDFQLPHERSGFIGLEIAAEEETEIFLVFDEYLVNGEWDLHRLNCRALMVVKTPAGKYSVLSAAPYSLKYLRVLIKGKAKVEPYLRLYENKEVYGIKVNGDEKFVSVFEAARNTFAQNALDIYMDCPSRERAGWLCDSYFTALAERLFTGKNTIERAFLENIILAETEELPEGMLPKCFPAQHTVGPNLYIPNWAMWFVIELESYLQRTGDRTLIDLAKEKVYKVVKFFKPYENEYGFLENLDGWVFVEWSISNSRDYTAGVNFPSNMLYAKMLECVDKLYDDKPLLEQAEKLKEKIFEFSYSGEFFVDNARRNEEGELIACSDHISETCQYYALFSKIKTDEGFKNRMKDIFGPLRANGVYPTVGKSNMFIGNYLRFFWLSEIGENERAVEECLEYFSGMAQKTGTLWEKDTPTASCNHGFASSIAVILFRR